MNKKDLAIFVARDTLGRFPPSIRSELLSRDRVKQELGMDTRLVLKLHLNEIEFDRDELFNSFRKLVNSSNEPLEIRDLKEGLWKVTKEITVGHTSIILKGEAFDIPIEDQYWGFHLDSNYRLLQLKRESDSNYLPQVIYQYWHDLLSTKVLDNDEHEHLRLALSFSPISYFYHMHNEFQNGTATVDALVPSNSDYYQRLAGVWASENNVSEYSEATLRTHLQQLLQWNQVEGLKLALVLCSHSSISELIDLRLIDLDSLESLFKWLIEFGDMTSLIGAIEIGLKYVNTNPNIAGPLEKVVQHTKEIIKDETGNKIDSGRIALHSALFVLVFGEVTRTNCLAGYPPFWRRLAAFAHAALIERVIIERALKIEPFIDWAYENGGHTFLCKTLIDLRLEPRWLPDYIDPFQVRSDFTGRLVGAGNRYESQIASTNLSALLIEDSPEGVRSLMVLPNAIYPGPLEGSISPINELPDEYLKDIESALNAKTIEVNSFARLVNASKLCRVTDNHALIAANALKETQYYLHNPGDSRHMISLINGLAGLASSSRSADLAKGIRILARVLRRVSPNEFGPSDELKHLMVAAAAYEQIDHWAEFISEWVSEIAYEAPIGKKAAEMLYQMRLLVKLEPALTEPCSKADAILCAAANSI